MNASSIKKAFKNNHLFSSRSSGSEYIFVAFIVVIAIITILITWVIYTLNKQFRGCDINPEQNKYNNTASMPNANSGIPNDEFNDQYKSLPINFYIKTAYNSCCGDSYKNTFVNKCALDNCINKGARCLDFEIYSYNNEPIIAASSVNNNYIKETYNHLDTHPILERIKNKCFDENENSDPLYLHFRIMSSNKEIYDKLGNQIDSVFGDQLFKDRNDLADKANYEKFLTDKIINSEYFKNKVIIIVNTKSKNLLNYGNSELSKHVNIISGNESFNLIRYNELYNKGESNSVLIQECKNKFVMVIPDLESNINNFDIVLPLSNGCQFIAMKFQNYDENLKSYLDYFEDSATYYSFKLKSEKLRNNNKREPATIDHGVTLTPPLMDCMTLEGSVADKPNDKCVAAKALERILVNPNDKINSGELLSAISAAQKAECDENLISDAFTRSTNISRDDNLISSKLNPSKYIVEKKFREDTDNLSSMFEESPKRMWRLYDLESTTHAITTEERDIFKKDICNLFNTKNQIVGLSSATTHTDKDNEMLVYLKKKFLPNSIEVMIYNTLIKYLTDSDTDYTINSC